ncbi:hypothetical protein HMPREF9457_02465, partial [Dorea formicigenerans 4_6_53AFAA]
AYEQITYQPMVVKSANALHTQQALDKP